MAAVDVVDTYLEGLPGETRRLAHGEWGVTLQERAGRGWPLHVGLRLVEGVLHVQAPALDVRRGSTLDAALVEPPTRFVRFTCTRGVRCGCRATCRRAVDELGLDRLLGLVVEGAVAVREYRRRESFLGTEDWGLGLTTRATGPGTPGSPPGRAACPPRARRGGAPRARRPVFTSALPRQKWAKSLTGARSTTASNSSAAWRSAPSGSRRGRGPRGSRSCRARAAGARERDGGGGEVARLQQRAAARDRGRRRSSPRSSGLASGRAHPLRRSLRSGAPPRRPGWQPRRRSSDRAAPAARRPR